MNRRLIIATLSAILIMAAIGASRAACISTEELKTRVEAATADFHDLSMTGTVTYKDRDALSKIDESYARLYEFKSAKVSMKSPDKIRIEGKLGMVRFEYIVNGGLKLVRAPMFNKKSDYSDQPAKLQRALDVGIVTPSLWDKRMVDVVDDAEAEARGEIKLKLQWHTGDMVYYAWLDSEKLWLKRFEKQDAEGNLLISIFYSEPVYAGEVVWMPTKVDIFSADGEKAGTSKFSDIAVNSALPDSLFE